MQKKISLNFSFSDMLVIIGALIFAVLIFVLYRPSSHVNSNEMTAYIYVNDQLIDGGEISLSNLETDLVVIISNENFPDLDIRGEVTVTIDRERGVAITEADCPNHDCVRQGFVYRENIPVVCAPNNVVVVLKSSNGGYNSPDAVIGMVSF